GSISRINVRTSVDLPEPESPMTTNTWPGETANETSRTAATQPVFSRSSARDSSRSGVPSTLSAFLPKIFQIPWARISGVAPAWPLEEANGLSVLVDVAVERRRCLAEPGHRLHVAAQGNDPAGARVR